MSESSPATGNEQKASSLEQKKIAEAVAFLKKQARSSFSPSDFKGEKMGTWEGGSEVFGAHQGLIALDGKVLGITSTMGGQYLADTRANRKALINVGYTFAAGLGVPQPDTENVNAPQGGFMHEVNNLRGLAQQDSRLALIDGARKDAQFMKPEAFIERYHITVEEFEKDPQSVVL